VKKMSAGETKGTTKPTSGKPTPRKAVNQKAAQRNVKGPTAKAFPVKVKTPMWGVESPKINETPKPSLPSLAVVTFGKAVHLFNQHSFEKAREAFEGFVERFPDEAEMVARARTYMAVCTQRLSRPPSTPRNAEALYNQGVFELNRGQLEQAIHYFEKALRAEPEADHVLYSLAAAHARMGLVTQALDELKRAVSRRESYRIQARRDPDFTTLYGHPAFQDLVGWEIVEGP
jgi:tetratricopeptide (TPR) repeat protein